MKPKLIPRLNNWAYIENPSILTAVGYTVLPDGSVKLEKFNTKQRNQLANNLNTIGNTALVAPTLSNDIASVYNVLRHPIKSGRIIYKTGKDALWFLTHPRAIKIYHGNRNGIKFDLKNAKTGSSANVGIHVTPNKNMAKDFTPNYSEEQLMEAYIPKEDMTTIDIDYNDYNLFGNDVKYAKTVGQYSYDDPRHIFGQVEHYFTSPGDNYKLKLLEKYGADPIVDIDLYGNYRLYLNNDVTIPLQKETWPNMTESVQKLFREIIEEGKSRNLQNGENFKLKAERLNQQAAKIASDNNKKVIKYHNSHMAEGNGGTAYIVTDPKVFYNPLKYNIPKILDKTKYPFIMFNENVK